MSRKSFIKSFPAFLNDDATTTLTSPESSVLLLDRASYHIRFSTANSGTFTVQAKNGEEDEFYDLDFGVPLTITSETEAVIRLDEMPFTIVRILWEPSSGAGTLTARLTAKSLGA